MTLSISASILSLLGYIGPGGGIGLLGPLVGVLIAVIGALAMVALWPIRYLIKKSRGPGGRQQPAVDVAGSQSQG